MFLTALVTLIPNMPSNLKSDYAFSRKAKSAEVETVQIHSIWESKDAKKDLWKKRGLRETRREVEFAGFLVIRAEIFWKAREGAACEARWRRFWVFPPPRKRYPNFWKFILTVVTIVSAVEIFFLLLKVPPVVLRRALREPKRHLPLRGRMVFRLNIFSYTSYAPYSYGGQVESRKMTIGLTAGMRLRSNIFCNSTLIPYSYGGHVDSRKWLWVFSQKLASNSMCARRFTARLQRFYLVAKH